MSFSKTFFTNLLRICSNLFTKKFLIFYFLKKNEFEFLNLAHFE
jgi:hypothetical protein